MDIRHVAGKLGISSASLEDLLAGNVTPGVASKLGVMSRSAEDFIRGETTVGMAAALGLLGEQGDFLRGAIGKEGAIGLILGILIEKGRQGRAG